MKKLSLMLALGLLSLAGFSQAQEPVKEKTAVTKSEENAAKADVLLIDKKAITKEEKKRKPKREKRKVECSRMKS